MRLLVFILWGCGLGTAWAQTPAGSPARELVQEGVKLYDEGRYAEAVAKYQQALAATPGDVVATSELALTYNTQGRHEEVVALCEKLLKANPASDESVYVSYGNSLDVLKRSKEALQAYTQGLKYYPESHSLYFNQGVAQVKSGQLLAGISSLQQAVALNPRYASAHMSLGVMQAATKARIPAILALARFLVLEPVSPRAMQRLPMLDDAMTQGVTRIGEKSITINIAPETMKKAGRNQRNDDDFSALDMLLALSAASTMGEEHKDASTTERFVIQFTSLCKTMGELNTGKQTGFTWSYYVPYFVELEKKGFVPALTYLIHSSQADVPEVQQWLSAHPNEVAVFKEWSKNYTWPKP
jgi:tetratricopeptide (TPR) repeat protein